MAQALREVSDNWSQARRRLVSDLSHLARATQAAAASYAQADDGEFRATTPAGTTPAGATR